MATRTERLTLIVGSHRARKWMQPLLIKPLAELHDLLTLQLAGKAPRGTPAACWIDDEIKRRERLSAHQQLQEMAAIQAAW